jgi:hypothetical protein
MEEKTPLLQSGHKDEVDPKVDFKPRSHCKHGLT